MATLSLTGNKVFLENDGVRQQNLGLPCIIILILYYLILFHVPCSN